MQTLFYCEVTDDMKVAGGGGVDDELIDVIEMSIPEVQAYMKQEMVVSPPSFMFAMQWFLAKMKVPAVWFIVQRCYLDVIYYYHVTCNAFTAINF